MPIVLKITSDLLWCTLKLAPASNRLLRCEVVGCNQQFLTHYVGGELVPIPDIPLERVELNEADQTVTVFLKRQVPLSSSHGGQPLHLVFAVAKTGDIALTEPIIVLAKQGKSGSRIKELASKRFVPISAERLQVREMIALSVCPESGRDDADAIAPALPPPAATTTTAEGMLSPPLRALADAWPPRPLASSNGSAEEGPVTPTSALAYALNQAAVSTRADASAPSPRPAARALEHAEALPRSTKR